MVGWLVVLHVLACFFLPGPPPNLPLSLSLRDHIRIRLRGIKF